MRVSFDSKKPIECSVHVPLDPATCFEGDLNAVQTRKWVVPGETLCFFVKTGKTCLQLDSLPFSFRLTRRPVAARRNTLTVPVLSPIAPKSVDITGVVGHQSFKSMQAFRLPTQEAVHPMVAKIPLTLNSPFLLQIFIAGQKAPVTEVELRPISPFQIAWDLQATTVSLVAIYKITSALKFTFLKMVELEGTSLRFATPPPNDEQDFESHIEILNPAPLKANMVDENVLSAVFLIRPLTEFGASLLTNNLLNFSVDWKYETLRYTTQWTTEVRSRSLGFALLLPPVAAQVMQTVTVPVKITNLRAGNRQIELVFEGGAVQPTAERIQVPELAQGSSTTVNISILPLMAGEHKLDFWAEENGKKIYPLFPTYISVVEAP
jgi:hypothetical protein